MGCFHRRWNGREPWLAQPEPHFLGRNGGKNPRGKRFFPLDSLLWWDYVGEGRTSYRIPGLRPSQWKARNGPPTGWAGWGRGGVPFGRRQRVTVRVSTFPPDNKPLLPPARAGGRAMRRWSWRPQARPLPDQSPSPVPPTREWGSKGKEPPSPWCSFPYFFKEIGPRPGGHRSRPFQRRGETLPHPTPRLQTEPR